jgi:hypothetical protein
MVLKIGLDFPSRKSEGKEDCTGEKKGLSMDEATRQSMGEPKASRPVVWQRYQRQEVNRGLSRCVCSDVIKRLWESDFAGSTVPEIDPSRFSSGNLNT